MYRDVNQYKDGEKEYNLYKGLVRSIHALQRLQQLQEDRRVKMKPAPSGETAYYLVEDVQPELGFPRRRQHQGRVRQESEI